MSMPTTENDRRNAQQPVLENPSLPDHNRTRDAGMHEAHPHDIADEETMAILAEQEENMSPADQEFEQILNTGTQASNGLIHDDPNNWITSDPEKDGVGDQDPEDRGESLPDILDNTKH
jgi:hypothetical protein